MNALFMSILNISITASWIVLGVLVLRLIFQKAPKWIYCILWAIVAVRLILPFSFESSVSMIPSNETVSENSNGQIQIVTGIPTIDNNIEQYFNGTETSNSADAESNASNFEYYLPFIWISGVFCMVSYGIFSYLVLKEKVDVSLKRSDGIYLCDGIFSPFILGILRPKIYLPSGLEKERENYVIAHEKAHLKRLDHLWKPLGFMLLSVYWFNPVLWVAYVLLCRDIESACDEKVIFQFDTKEKKMYSETLLSCSTNRRWILACPVAFGEVAVKDRIKSILHYKKPTLWIIIIALIASAVFSVLFLTDPSQTKIYEKRTEEIEFVNIKTNDYETKGYSKFAIRLVEDFLSEIEIERSPASRSRSDEREKNHSITISYGKNDNVSYYFNEKYNELWIDDGVKPSYSFKIKDPVAVLRFFEFSTDQTIIPQVLPGSESSAIGESDLDGAFTSEYLEMMEVYPDYFGLDPTKGIEVYVWQLARNSYSCAIKEGTGKNHKPNDLLRLPPISMSTVHRILELQNIDVNQAVLIPIVMPHSSYHYEITKEYVEKLETLFYPQTGNVMNVGSAKSRAFFDIDGDGKNEEVLISSGPEMVAPSFLIAAYEIPEGGSFSGYRPFDYYATFKTEGPFKAGFITDEKGVTKLHLSKLNPLNLEEETDFATFALGIDPLIPNRITLTKEEGTLELEDHMKYGIDSAFSSIGVNENGEVNYVYSYPEQIAN